MISAEEARKMLAENIKNTVNEEIEKIEDEIKIAISNNKNGIDIIPSISLEAQYVLEVNDYSVKNYQHYNEVYTNIKW